MKEPVEAQISEPDSSYRWDVRIGVVLGFLGFLGAQWLLFIKGPGTGDTLLEGALLELLACTLLAASLLMWSNSKRHAIGFDADGLWLVHVGKERGLVPWVKIVSIRENGFLCRMSLRGRGGERLIHVEYQRSHFQELRNLIIGRMSFPPPTLPRVFAPSFLSRFLIAILAVACGVVGVVAFMSRTGGNPIATVGRMVAGPICAFGALLFAGMTIFPMKVVVDREHVRVRRRRYPYSAIESVSMSFWRSRGQMYPRVSITLRDHAREPVFLAHGGDSLTFQRTVRWALERWREDNGGTSVCR